jgi:hypothetical protein
MTQPRWQFLDNRETFDGGTIVYHWRLDVWEKVCETSGQVVSVRRDRCVSHAGGMHPCRVWARTPECDHRHLDPEQQQPTCLTCGQVGEDVTAQVAAEMGA